MTEIPSVKQCKRCGIIAPLDSFPIKKEGKYGRREICRECWKIYYRFWARKPEQKKKRRDYYFKNKEEISRQKRIGTEKTRFRDALKRVAKFSVKSGYAPCVASENEIRIAFTGKCHSCDLSENENGERLQLDHDHTTGKFRGWLCGGCNKALGLLRNSPEKIQALYMYSRNSFN